MQPSMRSEAESPIQVGTEKGIDLLSAGKAKKANAEFNRALALAPSDANLHFLNGLAYREMARTNGQAVAELAETGYRLALEFDSNHWLAAWHLGLLQVEQRQYDAARKSFAIAARLRPRNPDIQLALAGSAYQASDAPVALWAANNTLTLRPNDPEALRIASLSSAALGMESSALEFRDRFQQANPSEDVHILNDRIRAWKRVHAQADISGNAAVPAQEPKPGGAAPDTTAQPVPPADSTPGNLPPVTQASPSGAPGGAGSAGEIIGEQGQGVLASSWSDCVQSSTSQSSSSSSWGGGSSSGWGSSTSSDATEKLPALPSPCKGIALPRMTVVDVTIVRTQETTGYTNGVNLLDGLKIVLGGSWVRESTSHSDPSDDTRSTTITRSLGLPEKGITYSLNIFNAGDTVADVIARPSLLALDRTPATFFSGSTISVAQAGEYGGTLSDKNIGVSLSVTPTFIDDDRLLLAVKGARSFLEPAQFEGLDTLTSTNNIVSTNVIMRFGETLILSGLREREFINGKQGVPLLRDVPVVQYLFSTHEEYDYSHHVLILLTPRKPASYSEILRAANAYAYSPEFQKEPIDTAASEANDALRPQRPHLEAIMGKLRLNRYQHEFRTGDLSHRRFAPRPSLERVLQDVKKMMYF
ncbi:MAG: tetratricopeptide repeat protein [Desulfobulbia bacterium]